MYMEYGTQTARGTLAHLEALVLQHLLDGHQFVTLDQLGLEHHAEGPVADHLRVHVGHLLRPVGAAAGGGHHCGHLVAILACGTTQLSARSHGI